MGFFRFQRHWVIKLQGSAWFFPDLVGNAHLGGIFDRSKYFKIYLNGTLLTFLLKWKKLKTLKIHM